MVVQLCDIVKSSSICRTLFLKSKTLSTINFLTLDICSCLNISASLLSFIVKNWKEEASISKFSEIQKLQEEIRSNVFHYQPISSIKAFMATQYNNPEWNRLLPPLVSLQDPSNNSIVISLIELIKKMKELLSDS